MDSGMRGTTPLNRALICGDCSDDSCQWASVNRGVYLCDDCVTIHRQLGRHYSQIKHLKQSQWEQSLHQMLQNLVSNGANKIWEHNLLDPATKSNKRYIAKPNPTDDISFKRNYIKVSLLSVGRNVSFNGRFVLIGEI